MRILKLLLVLGISIFLACKATAQVDYSGYIKILEEHVSSTGEVDYSGIVKNDNETLNKFVRQLATVDPDRFSKDQRLAYWINVYNAFTIKMIVGNWPVESIQDIADGKPFEKEWIELNGKKYSLNQIENDKIRTPFQDARIHFAVNCAAKSCPPLFNKPFTGDHIDQQLDQCARKFINNDAYNQISKNSVTLSRIFDWYKSDFGNLIDFINNYSKTIINSGANIRYSEYDWALNNGH